MRLTRGFWMAAYETTQRQWRDVMGEWPDEPPSASSASATTCRCTGLTLHVSRVTDRRRSGSPDDPASGNSSGGLQASGVERYSGVAAGCDALRAAADATAALPVVGTPINFTVLAVRVSPAATYLSRTC